MKNLEEVEGDIEKNSQEKSIKNENIYNNENFELCKTQLDFEKKIEIAEIRFNYEKKCINFNKNLSTIIKENNFEDYQKINELLLKHQNETNQIYKEIQLELKKKKKSKFEVFCFK